MNCLVVKRNKYGRGVYTTKDLKKGTLILRDHLMLIPANDYDTSLIIKRYAFEWPFDNFFCSAISLGLSSLFNHSKRANCDFEPFLDENDLPRIGITVIKNVKAGSELTFDYGYNPKELM